MPSGSGGRGPASPRPPQQVQERHPGHDPDRGIEAVRDRLGAVRAGPRVVERHGPPAGSAPGAPARGRGPGPWAPRRASRGTTSGRVPRRSRRRRSAAAAPAVPLRDLEPRGIGGQGVGVEAQQARVFDRHRREGHADQVVVDADAMDPAALREVGLRGVAKGDAVQATGPRGGAANHAPVSCSSPPVARRSSSACMNASRSPSRTLAVFEVSCRVRRSLTIW